MLDNPFGKSLCLGKPKYIPAADASIYLRACRMNEHVRMNYNHARVPFSVDEPLATSRGDRIRVVIITPSSSPPFRLVH